MAAKPVYVIPECKNLEGLNLQSEYYNYLFQHRIDDFRLKKEENTLICSYPRTGTTWLSQIVSLLLASDAEYENVKRVPLAERVLYLELSETKEEPQISRLHTVPPPRAVKTHMKYKLIRRWVDEDRVKIIMPTRNPKDALVSIFHQYQDTIDYGFDDKSWDEFFEHVQAGLQEHGDQYEWLRDWTKFAHSEQILFLKYEDMKQNISTQVKRIADFLGLELSDSKLAKVLHDSSIKQMKNDAAAQTGQETWLKEGGSFVRKGGSGGWRNYFTVAQNEWYDAKYKKLYADLPIDVHYE